MRYTLTFFTTSITYISWWRRPIRNIRRPSLRRSTPIYWFGAKWSACQSCPMVPFAFRKLGPAHLLRHFLLLLLPLVGPLPEHSCNSILLRLGTIRIGKPIWNGSTLALRWNLRHRDLRSMRIFSILRHLARHISGGTASSRFACRQSLGYNRGGSWNNGGIVIIL